VEEGKQPGNGHPICDRVGFISLSVCTAALLGSLRFPGRGVGRLGWIAANALVMFGGVLVLWLAPDWAGWLTATFFGLLVALPLALLSRSKLAERRGQWKRAARLLKWAALFHPSPWTRFRLTMMVHGPTEYAAALKQIESSGSRKQRALARLLLAHERRDWKGLLTLSRDGDAPFAEAKPREIRALGELGRLDEMVQTYQKAARWLPLDSRRECILFVLAFTGRIERVQPLLDRLSSAIDDDSRIYWMGVARLRRDLHDEAARSMLRRLTETGTPDGVRRSAAQQLQQAEQDFRLSISLTDESARAIDAMRPIDGWRWPDELQQWVKRTRKARLRAAMLSVLLFMIWTALRSYYGW